MCWSLFDVCINGMMYIRVLHLLSKSYDQGVSIEMITYGNTTVLHYCLMKYIEHRVGGVSELAGRR